MWYNHLCFLAHLSQRLKWAFLITICPLSVVVVVVAVVNFSHFHILLKNHWANFSKHGTKYPWKKGIQVCSNEGYRSFPREDNNNTAKNTLTNFKIFFSRTTVPISTKFSRNHLWVKGIQICSKEGPSPFPRGDNYEIAKIQLRILKNLLLQNHWGNFNQN